MGIMTIIFLFGCYPILFVMYFMFKDVGNKNRYCFGATISPELKKDPSIKAVETEFRKKIKRYTVVLAIAPISVIFLPYFSIEFTIWMVWILIVCFYPMILFAIANKKVQDIKSEYEKEHAFTDTASDDRFWPYGLIYYNPNDTDIMVENRMGTGMAMNMARGITKGLNLFAILCTLSIPLLCIWMMMQEFTPISTKVEDEKIICAHLSVEYEIPLAEIEEYTVIKELPEMTKVKGNGMDHVLSGTYEIYREGMFETFLNPQNNIFIKIETGDEMYYISGVDDQETQAIIDVLDK